MKGKTPYELLNGRKPNIAYFRVFGCKCYILKKGTRLGKFEKKCDEGFLLDYSTTSKAYRVWNLDSGTLEEVHDVEFDETKGSQDENENLEDVRGIQLSNAMKNMVFTPKFGRRTREFEGFQNCAHQGIDCIRINIS